MAEKKDTTAIALIVALIAFGVFYYKDELLNSFKEPAPPPPPREEIHMTGQSREIPDINPFNTNKVEIAIQFNGYSVISGITDNSHNGHFVGAYKGTPVEADCSGSNTITCHIQYKDMVEMLNFTLKDKL